MTDGHAGTHDPARNANMERVLRRFGHEATETGLKDLADKLTLAHGPRAASAALNRMQVALGHRRMSIGIYDHALHVVGGGQKYVATLAAALQDHFDVTYLVNRPVELGQLRDWYDLDLSRCRLRVVPLPFYERRQWIDAGIVTGDMDNPFEAVARASADFDVFVNANMLEKVQPLAPLSIFVCHFPDVVPRAHFAAHEYTFVIANSRYTSAWLRRRWGLEPSMLLYPPIGISAAPRPKERIVLSVARFEPGGSKKQREMIAAFVALKRALPDLLHEWRLVLVGGTLQSNAYLDDVRRDASTHPAWIDVRANCSSAELRNWYGRATIFWHACGVGEIDPQLIEHFGMATVEAMQNGCVPVVFDGGGQREIVEHGVNGLRFQQLDALSLSTARLIADEPLLASMRERARQSSERFARAPFDARVRALFDLVHREYAAIDPSILAE